MFLLSEPDRGGRLIQRGATPSRWLREREEKFGGWRGRARLALSHAGSGSERAGKTSSCSQAIHTPWRERGRERDNSFPLTLITSLHNTCCSVKYWGFEGASISKNITSGPCQMSSGMFLSVFSGPVSAHPLPQILHKGSPPGCVLGQTCILITLTSIPASSKALCLQPLLKSSC